MRKGDLKGYTEALICSAQEQALRTTYIKFRIDKKAESPMCRMCGEKAESGNQLTSECSKLAQHEYKRRHDNVARYVHWQLCRKAEHERTEKWYKHTLERVVENEGFKVPWDFNDKRTKEAKIIDIAIPGDARFFYHHHVT